MATPEDPEKARRRFPRAKLVFDVRMQTDSFSSFIEEQGTTISEGGMFIATTDPKPVGSIVNFQLSLGGERTSLIAGTGEVRWIRGATECRIGERPGMGIQFIDLDPASVGVIQKIVSVNSRVARPKSTGAHEIFRDLDENELLAGLADDEPAEGRAFKNTPQEAEIDAALGRLFADDDQDALVDTDRHAPPSHVEEPGPFDDLDLSLDLASSPEAEPASERSVALPNEPPEGSPQWEGDRTPVDPIVVPVAADDEAPAASFFDPEPTYEDQVENAVEAHFREQGRGAASREFEASVVDAIDSKFVPTEPAAPGPAPGAFEPEPGEAADGPPWPARPAQVGEDELFSEESEREEIARASASNEYDADVLDAIDSRFEPTAPPNDATPEDEHEELVLATPSQEYEADVIDAIDSRFVPRETGATARPVFETPAPEDSSGQHDAIDFGMDQMAADEPAGAGGFFDEPEDAGSIWDDDPGADAAAPASTAGDFEEIPTADTGLEGSMDDDHPAFRMAAGGVTEPEPPPAPRQTLMDELLDEPVVASRAPRPPAPVPLEEDEEIFLVQDSPDPPPPVPRPSVPTPVSTPAASRTAPPPPPAPPRTAPPRPMALDEAPAPPAPKPSERPTPASRSIPTDLDLPLEQSISALFEPSRSGGSEAQQPPLPLDDAPTIKATPFSMNEAARKRPLAMERRVSGEGGTRGDRPEAAPRATPSPSSTPPRPPAPAKRGVPKWVPALLGVVGLAIVAGALAVKFTGGPDPTPGGDPTGAPVATETPTEVPSPSPTVDATPSPTPTEGPEATPTEVPTATPTTPVGSPTASPSPSPSTSPRPASDRPARRITRISREGRGEGFTLQVQGDGRLKFNAFELADPRRFVVDFPGIASDDRRTTLDAGSGLVSRVRLGHDAEKVRIVLDLNGAARGSATEVGDLVEIRVTP